LNYVITIVLAGQHRADNIQDEENFRFLNEVQKKKKQSIENLFPLLT